MQSLSSMLSPLRMNREESTHNVASSSKQDTTVDFKTPLTITIPPNDYEMVGLQNIVNHSLQNNKTDSMWSVSHNPQPLLTSRAPEIDALSKWNEKLGNQYNYRTLDMESASNIHCSHRDPRMEYDKTFYSTANAIPYKDFYYQCAYGEPKTERIATRHKLDDDIGPEAKRHRVGESTSRFGNERSVIVQNTCFFGSASSTTNG